jgi:hypothetical protein
MKLKNRERRTRAENHEAQPSHGWYDLRDELRFQNEVERAKGVVQAYRYVTPPR